MSSTASKFNRRSIRLDGYDYSQPGYYFITVVTREMACMFGTVRDGAMHLNGCGQIVADCWKTIPVYHPYVRLDHFVVMPNHIHGILEITDRACVHLTIPGSDGVSTTGSRLSHTVGSVVRGFKAGVTSRIRDTGFVGVVWHRDYWEHIIRGYESLNEIRTYISNNPLKWDVDRFYDDMRPVGRM